MNNEGRMRFNQLNVFRAVQDEQSMMQSLMQPPLKDSRLVIAPGMYGGRYVPVAAAAKDWHVSTRRIRALLQEGRLLGFQDDNGYWLVHFPYQFTFGTRGPSLKRQQKPKKRNSEGNESARPFDSKGENHEYA